MQHITHKRCTQTPNLHHELPGTPSLRKIFLWLPILKLNSKWSNEKGIRDREIHTSFYITVWHKHFIIIFFLPHWEKKGNTNRLFFPMTFPESREGVFDFTVNSPRWVGFLEGWEPKVSRIPLYSDFFPHEDSHRWICHSSKEKIKLKPSTSWS